jgi:ferredoxin
MPKVHFRNEVLTVEARQGQTIREVAEANGIELHRGLWTWASALCHPKGVCGSCKVWVSPAAPGAISEKTTWERIRPKVVGTVRLGCQARILGDCEVTTKPGGDPARQNVVWEADPRPSRWKERLQHANEEEDTAAKPQRESAAASATKP